MNQKIFIRTLAWIVLIILASCSVKWTTVINYGEVDCIDFYETIDIEVQNGLIFVPVQIGGKKYNFLFDSGAPFSISKKLQKTFNFKVISKGNIVDSDNNRKKVNYVQVDTIYIGSIPFTNQTAFEGDFTSNPILECLKIDGIIGSNLMRHTNWTVDQSLKKITLSNTISQKTKEKSIIVPFQTDNQYNILVSIGIGASTVKNLKIDYGSNGPISLDKNVFSLLKERKIIGKTYLEKGSKRSGIIGKSVSLNRQITFVDSLELGELKIDDVELRSGSSPLIGNKILSKYIVTIDWGNSKLYFRNNNNVKIDTHKTFGLSLVSSNETIYVQSVIENSDAFKKGIVPGMQVLKLDSLDFLASHNYCDYVSLAGSLEKLLIETIDSKGQKKEFQIERTSIKN
jgi:hypothetical protein